MCECVHMGRVGKAFALKLNPPNKLFHQNTVWQCLYLSAQSLAFLLSLLVSEECGHQNSVWQEALSPDCWAAGVSESCLTDTGQLSISSESRKRLCEAAAGFSATAPEKHNCLKNSRHFGLLSTVQRTFSNQNYTVFSLIGNYSLWALSFLFFFCFWKEKMILFSILWYSQRFSGSE